MAGSRDQASGEDAGATPESGRAPEQATDRGLTNRQAEPAKDTGPKKDSKAGAAMKAMPALIRTRIAQAVWLVCVVAALLLALGALAIALDLNQQNTAVDVVLSGANRVDLDVFTRQGGIKQFTGEDAATRNALVNYGAGALFYLVVGRTADWIIRP